MIANIKHIPPTPGVYYILNKMLNRVYVGQSQNMHNRIRTHLSLLNQHKHHAINMQWDWNDCGAHSFEFGILTNHPSLENTLPGSPTIEEIERHFIRTYRADCVRFGYNMKGMNP
jgi:group I intron endonuclease